ncbi:type VI secretion system contractile sheath small subunit [Pseudomonas sp. LJDD11]|nr:MULTISPECIES: type VI secretion system contractile sheath small subunit [unclassified Pseudomonas]MCQ9422896.1 type VI secretion system contractile sheath small subunit [Pseudomonas sp. LJDD11]BAP45289.1 type VI secretion protein [Pseudomonas sp. StFLB209]
MAANQESKQRYLGRNRPPRVQITYDVEIGNAFETKELPLVVGILSDLSGNSAPAKAGLDKRGFVDIDRDNFNTVLSKIHPQVSFTVENVLEGQSGNLKVDLQFNSIDDFSPEKLVRQVNGLKELFEKRQRLQDLLIKLDGNEALDQSLVSGLSSDDAVKQLQAQLAAALPAPTPALPVNTDTPAGQDETPEDPNPTTNPA